MTLTFSQIAHATQLAALTTLLDDGYLRVYDGKRPSTPDSPIEDQVLLAELRFDRPSFSVESNGSVRANQIKPEKSARADGNVSWYRTFTRDGKTPVLDGTIGTADADIIVARTDIQATARFSINDYRLRVPGRVDI